MKDLTSLLRFWLMKHPRGEKFRVTCGSAPPQIIEVGPRVSWARLAETITALDAELVEALQKNDALVRAVKLEDLENAHDDDDDAPAVAAPALPPPDAETVRFLHVTSMIASAYKEAQAQVGMRNGEIFNRMLDLFETVSTQNENQANALELANKTLIEESLKAAVARATSGTKSEGGGGMFDDLVESVMGGLKKHFGIDEEPEAAEPEAEAEPVGPNGKGPH